MFFFSSQISTYHIILILSFSLLYENGRSIPGYVNSKIQISGKVHLSMSNFNLTKLLEENFLTLHNGPTQGDRWSYLTLAPCTVGQHRGSGGHILHWYPAQWSYTGGHVVSYNLYLVMLRTVVLLKGVRLHSKCFDPHNC